MAKKLLNTQEDFKNWAAQQFGNQAAPATGAASANTGAGQTQAQQEQSVRNEALERLKGESQMEQPEDLEKAIDRHIKGQLFPGYENSDKSVLEQIAANAIQAFPSAMRTLREQIGGIFGGNGGQQEQKPGTKFTFAGGNKAGAAQAEAPREYTGDEVNDAVKHIDELLGDKNLSWEDKIALQSDRNLLTDYAGGVVQHDAANNESVGAVIGRWGSRKAPETPETTFSFGSSLVADKKRLEALKAEREELISATMQYPLRVTDKAAAGEAVKRLAEILPQIRTLEGQVAQKQQDEQARQEAARVNAMTDVERFLEGRMSQEEFNQLPESDRNEVMAMYHVYGEDGAQQVLNRLNDEKQVYTAMGLTAQEFSDLRPELREEALRTWREDASHAGFYSMLAREDWSYGSDVFKPGSKSAAADQMELADRDAKKRQEEGDKLAADMEEERLRARYESMTPKDAAEAVRKIDEQLEAIKATGVPWQPIMFADENGEFPIVYSPTTSANIEKLTWARNELSQYAGGEKDFDGMTVADLIDQADQVIGDSENTEASLRAKIPALRAERDKYEPYTQEWKDAHQKMVEAEILADEAYRVENPVAYFLNNDLIRYRDAAISAAAPAMENMVGMYLKTPVDMAHIAQDLWDFTAGQIKQDRIDKDGNIRYGIPDVIRATTGYKSATDNPVINALKTASDTFLKKAEIDNKRSVAEWTDLMVEQGVKKEDAQRYADLVITKGLTSAGASLGFMLPGMKYRGPVNPSNLASVIKSPQYWMMAAQTAGAGIREDHELLGNNYTVFDMAANFINGIANSAIELYDPLDIDIFRYLGRKLDLPDFVGSAVSSGAGESGEEILQEGVERGIKVGADVLSGRKPRYDPTLSVENLTKSGTLFSLADYGDIGLNTFISTQGINLMNAVGTRAAYAMQNPYKAAVLATLDGTATEEQKDLAGRVAVAAAAVDAVAEQQEQKANGGAPTEQQQHDAFEQGLTGQGAPEDTQPAVNPIQVLDEQRRAGRVKKPAGAADALRRAAEDAQKGKFLPPEQVQQIVEEQSGDKAGEKPGLPELPENDRDQYDREESNQQLQDLQTEAERPGEAQATRDQEPQPTTTWRDEQKKKLEENPEPVPVPARPEMREAEQKAPETMERPAAPERLIRPMDASGAGEAMDALVAAAQARTGNQHLSPEEVQAAVDAAQGGMEQTAQTAEETGKAAEEAAGAQADVDQDEKLDTDVNEPQQGEQESDRLDTDVTQPEEKAAESDRLDTDVNSPKQEEQESDRLGTEINTPQEQAQADQNGKLETETGEPPEEKPQDSQEKLETQTGEPPEEQENDNARLDTETEQPQEQEAANADARSDTEINDVTAAASTQETTAGTQERSGSSGGGGSVSVTSRVQTSGQVNLERTKADLQYDSDGIELYSSREKTAQLLNQAQGLSDDLRQAGLHFASWSGGTQMDADTRNQMTVMNDYLKKIGYSAVMDSEITNGKGAYANGSYTYSDVNGHKVIHIAQNSKNPFITVLSHELTHALRTNNPGAYVDLKRAFIKYAQNAGLDVGALVKAKMDLYERHGKKLNGLDEETGYNAEALEEVIADAMYDVIGDEQAIKSLAAKNPGLIQSIKNWITETLDKIHQLLNGYADKTPQAKMLRDQAGALEELRGIMNDALTETRPIREEKARVANVGSNGELTEKFQEAIREAEGREEMNKAAGELADGILRGQGLEASLGNRQRLYTAAGDFMLSGGTISEAMELFDLKWTAGTAEQNRAFAALGKYVQGLMERNNVEGYQGLMEEEEIVEKEQFSFTDDTATADESSLPNTLTELYEQQHKADEEIRKNQKALKDYQNSPEMQELLERLGNAKGIEAHKPIIEEMKALEEKAGVAQIKDEIERLKERKKALNRREEEIRRNELLKKVQDSGKNAEDYFRDAAVKEFGYTSYFYDAGYILPNGKMLNFSGEKGKHFGTRGQDHRAIGTIYEGTMGQTAGMNAFINDGNIRIMDEKPGIDLSISRALTDEQEATVRRHILRSGSRGYHVDFTGPDGRTVQTLDYQPGTKAEKILSDIAQTVRQGKAPEQSVTAQFHTMYSFSEDEDTAEKEDFTLSEPVEETRELVAVHNLNEAKLEKALEDGGLIGPSIAVMKKQTLGANNHYGDISIIFRRDTIDPDVSEDNRLYGADAWTPMYDSYHDYENPEDVLDDMKRQPERGYEAGAEYVSGNLEDMDNAAAKIYRNVREMKDDSGRIQYDLFGNIKRNKQRLINEAKEMGFREEGQQTLVDIATLMTTRENLDLLKGEEPSEAAKRLIRRNLHSLRSDEEITKIYKLIRSFANLPTQYFEAKAMRIVKPEEWAAVVVPEKNRHLARVLKDAGIKVLTYSTEKGISTRSMVINEFAEQERIKFSMMDQQGDDAQQGRTAAEAEDEWNLYSDIAGTDDNAYQLINNLIALRTRETENADGRIEHKTGAWKGQIAKQVDTIAQQYGNGNKGYVERKLRALYNEMDGMATEYGARSFVDESLRAARTAVREIYGSQEENQKRDDLKEFFGGRTIYLDQMVLDDAKMGEGGVKGLRSRLATVNLKVTTKAKEGAFHLESEWEEVARRFGLDPDISNPADQLMELDEMISNVSEYGGVKRALTADEDRILDLAALDLVSGWIMAGSTPVVQRTVTHIDQEHQQKALDRIDELEAQVSKQADTIESQAQQLADEKAKTRTVLDQLFKRAHELEDLKRSGANRAELDEARKAYAELANKHAETVKANKGLEKKLEKAREKHRELHRELSEARKAEKKAETRAEQLQQRIEKQKERLDKKLEEQKGRFQQQQAKAKQLALRQKQVERIRKTGRKLGRMLASPKQNKYVPQDMVRAAADFVDALLDNTGRNSDKAGAKLQRMIREARSSSDYNVAHSFDETLENQLNQVNELLNDKGALRNMSDGEIALIAGTAEQLMHQINEAGKLQGRQDKADIMEEATDAVKTFNDNPRELNGLKGVLGNYLLNHKNPQRVFRALAGYKDNAVARLGNELSEGQRRKNMLTMKATKCFEELTKGRNAKNFLRFTGEDQSGWTDIGVDRLNEQGKKVGTYKMTGEMKASFALHWASEDNRKGMSIPGSKDLYQLVMPDENLMKKGKVKEAYQRGSRMTFTSAQARAIIDSMTEYEQKWVAAWRSMEEILQPAINETSMTLKHYRIATVENYFPIHRDRAYIASDFESIVMDRSLENMGFTKERVNARNPMLLEGLTDVINTQINSVSDYVGYAVPVKNFNKVYNAVMPGYADSVKAALYRTQGKEVAQYLEKLMSDIQGGQRREASFLDKLRGKYAGAVLTLNPAVTIKQAASYPTAASVLGWNALNKALPYFANSKAISTDLIDTYTSAHWERRSEALKDAEGNAKNASAVRKSANKFLNSIQEMDVLTTKVLWKAAEFRVQETTKLRPGSQEDIKNGTDAYYQAVARLYEQAIEETQPEYGVMQRPQILRHDSEIVRSLTMFKTQPLQNLGILLDSFGEMRAAAKAAGAKDATKADQEWFARSKQTFTRAVTSQVVSGVVLAIMTMVGKALLHKMDPYRDEKGDITAQSTGKQILSDTLGSWAGMVAGGSEIYELIAGVINGQSPFDIEAAGVSTINDLYQNLYGLLNSATVIGDSSLTASEKWEKIGKQIRKSGMSVAQMLGLPVNNMMNLMDGLATNGLEIATGVGGSFREESAMGRIPLIGILLGGAKGRNVSNTKVAPYIAGAMADGDRAEAERLYNEQLRQGKSGQAVSTAIKTALKREHAQTIREAAQAIEKGDVTTYNNLINQMTKGGVNMANAVSWVETERKKIGKAGAEENNESAKETAPIRLTYDEIMESLLPANAKSEQYTTGMLTSLQESGNLAEAQKVYQKLLETRKASSIQSSMTSYWKPQLVAAYNRGDMTEVKRIKSMLMKFGYKEKTIANWTKKKKAK